MKNIEDKIDEWFDGDMWKEDEAFKEAFHSLDDIFSDMWKQVKKFDKKHKTKIWNKIVRNMQKLEGMVNDVGSDVLDSMKRKRNET